jgi:hypothetical protein
VDRELEIKLKLDRSQARDEQGRFVTDARASERQVLSAAEASEAGRAQAAARAGRQRVAAADAAAAGVRSAAERERDALEQSGKAGTTSFAKMVAASGLAQAGIQKLIGLAHELGRAWDQAGEKSRQLTKNFSQQRDDLRELATLMGDKADNAFTLKVARFNETAGMRPGEGKDFLTELYNSGAQYEGKNISKEEFKEYTERTGKLTSVKGLSPTESGNIAGTVLGFRDYSKLGDKAAEQATDVMNTSIATLLHGKGRNSVLMNQFGMLSSAALNEDALKGTFTSPEQVAAVTSVAAEKHDAQAAELAKMAGRGLRDFDNPLVQKAKVDRSDDFITAFTKIGAVVDTEVKARQATTPGFKVEDYLRENLKDEGTIDAFNVFLNKGVFGGAFKERMDFAATQRGKAEPETAAGEKEEAFIRRREEAKGERLDLERGAENSQVEIARRQALNRLIERREVDTNEANVGDFLREKTTFGALGSGQQQRIDDEVVRMLNERAPEGTAPLRPEQVGVTSTGRESMFRDFMGNIRSAHGNPLEEAAPGTARPQILSPENPVVELMGQFGRGLEAGIGRGGAPPALEAGARTTPAMQARPPDAAAGSRPTAEGRLSGEAVTALKEIRDAVKNPERQPTPPPAPAVKLGAPRGRGDRWGN